MSTIKLSELVTIRKGRKAPEVYDSQINGTKRYLQISDLRGEGEPRFAVDPKGVLSNERDVIIAWDGANAGTVSFDLEGYIGSTLTILRLKNDNVDTAFLGRYLQSRFSYLNELTTGATIPHIDRARLEGLLIPFPPLPEQRRIAAILDKADAIRRKRQEAIRLTDEFLRSAFLEMFGDSVVYPVTQDLPDGWRSANVGQIKSPIRYSCVGGPFGSNLTRADYIEKQGIPVIRGSNLSTNSADLIEENFVYVSNEKANSLAQNVAFPGDVIFTQRGTLGQVVRIPLKSRHPKYIISQSQMKLTVDEQKADPIYIVYYFRSPRAVRDINARILATGVPHINLGIFRDFPIVLPPIKLQRRFAEIKNQHGAITKRFQEASLEAEVFLNSLVQRAFRGGLKPSGTSQAD